MSAFLSELAAAISRASGDPFTVRTTQAVSGGDISQAFRVGDGARTFFVKVQPALRLDMFEAEASGLAELARARAVRVPDVVCHGTVAGQAYLVLEYLPLAPGGDAAQLGRQLAQQHRVSAPQFGWSRDNWIGATLQPNAWREGWIEFWREQRLGFQLRLAAQNGHGGTLQRNGEALMSHLDALFATYTPASSLLHGDLWGGNHAYLADGSPVIFDPAVYVGDRECDLAMSELFGGFAPAFYAAYREAWPLDAGYATRKTLYNLYHILNHANLFGGGYAAQAARMTAQLLAQIR
ncbi:MAG: fructosamine kinase family protein [Thiobacillus sp.]